MPKGRQIDKTYWKYSGMAFQMFVFLLLGWLIGDYIDGLMGLKTPVFTLVFLFLFLAVFFVKLIRDVSNENGK